MAGKVPLILFASLLAGAACNSPAGPDSQGDLDYNRLLQGLRQSGLERLLGPQFAGR